MNFQAKRAGEDRELENKDFQGVIADQRATQKLLGKALSILKGFYGVQVEKKQPLSAAAAAAGPAPPPGFKDFSKNKNAGGVMGLIQKILDDAKEMEQTRYEKFVKDTNDSVDAAQKDITNKSAAR